jgi:hypothetical protein
MQLKELKRKIRLAGTPTNNQTTLSQVFKTWESVVLIYFQIIITGL